MGIAGRGRNTSLIQVVFRHRVSPIGADGASWDGAVREDIFLLKRWLRLTGVKQKGGLLNKANWPVIFCQSVLELDLRIG
jgi:hypothetical protein